MLIDIQTSNPPFIVNQSKATEELKKRMGDRPSVTRLIDAASIHSGINTRYIVIPDADELHKNKFYSSEGNYIQPDTQKRMEEYEKWSKFLACEAVGKIFNSNSIKPQDIQRLITISCTGFFAPGLDYYLIEEFNIPRNVKRTNIGFMGCAASIIGFTSALEAMESANDELNTLVISLELCSLHLQTEPTRDNILANMIFADGCAAALFSNAEKNISTSRLKLLKTESVLFDDTSKMMGWKIGNTGFAMNLSSELPSIILKSAVPAALKILKDSGLAHEDIRLWALHPGGRAILDALKEGLHLSDEQMLPSRNVLYNYGNMSSASILYVLKELISNPAYKIQKDDLCCTIAFGPGLTMELALFRGL